MNHPVKSFQPTYTLAVEYTSGRPALNGPRVRKLFSCPVLARRFYAVKLKAGAEPKLVNLAR